MESRRPEKSWIHQFLGHIADPAVIDHGQAVRPRQKCAIRVNADNLMNKNAWAGAGGNLASPLTPRMFKAAVSVKF